MFRTVQIVASVGALLLLCPAVTRGEQDPQSDFAFLGVQTETRVPGDEKSGVVVSYVFPASSAQEIGFRKGDEIRVFNDMIIPDQKTFVAELRAKNVGAKVRFTVRREGQDVKIEGRLGSYQRTMKAYQDSIRKAWAAKPLPTFPEIVWWSPQTKDWDPKLNGLENLKGKLSVVFSFDTCKPCREGKLKPMAALSAALAKAQTSKELPLGFAGIFFEESLGKDKSLKEALKILNEVGPDFPVGVAFYPGDKLTVEDRQQHFLLQTHGTAILGKDGAVKYVQTLGLPREEFGKAYQQALAEAQGGAKPPVSGETAKPSENGKEGSTQE